MMRTHPASRGSDLRRRFTFVQAIVGFGAVSVFAAALLPPAENARRESKQASAARDTDRPMSAPSSAADVASSTSTSNTIAPSQIRPAKAQAEGAVGGGDGGVAGLAPSNDNCTSCTQLATGQPVAGSTLGATGAASSSCGGGNDKSDVWFCWTPQCGGIASISLCGSQFDTTLAVYDGCALTHAPTELACDDDACTSPFAGPSRLTMHVNAGQTYYIRVAGFGGAVGSYTLVAGLDCSGCVTCPTGSLAEGELNCGIPSDTTNGGCNTPPGIPPQFTRTDCDVTYCGTAAFDGATRDTDWYQVAVTSPTAFTWTVDSEFAATIGLVETNPPGAGNCANTTGNLNPSANIDPCTTGSVTTCVPPGVYWLFVAPQFIMPTVPCGSEYWASLTCTTCVLSEACCVPNGRCVDTAPQICDLEFQGTSQGPGTSCNTVHCPLPTGACCADGCFITDQASCESVGGPYLGDGTVCTPTSCQPPTEACCLPNGGCESTTPAVCQEIGGIPQGPGTNCDDAHCGAVEVDFFPNTSALMELQMPNGQSVPIALSGPTTVHVFFEGPNEGDASDNDGNGLDEVQTEMVDMSLTGVSPFGPVVVHLNPNLPSRGQIEETANTQPGRLDLPPFAPTGTANSFFDVFFEIQVGGQTFHTAIPKRMSSVIDHKPPGPGTVYENPEKIPLLDANGNPTGISIGAGRHIPNPPVEVDFFPNTSALMELQMPNGQSVPIALSGPTTVHVFFEGANEGDASDNDGNGLDEVQTEMVDMSLTGVSPFGPVVVHLNPNLPSRGQIEETANTQPGRLDLPPFAPAGTANSFFDVFFEIQVGGQTFHTAIHKRMSSVIDHKPPGPGTVYENPEKIPLLDANGNPTGRSIGAGRHIPNPPVEVDFFPNTSALMELQLPNGDSVPIALSGPTAVHVFFEGPNEGDASDNDGNGLDEVQTEMVDMHLTGVSPFGPVVVMLNPNLPSRGQIEETANTQPGRLDLPPFAPAGTANSFFDLFFEIQVGAQTFHTAIPKRMSSVIDHKPPGPGTVYENPEKIPLLDANGNPTGLSIGAGSHTPRPQCGSPGTGDCFTPHDTPFCDQGVCCERVCALAPNCCGTGWSTLCAGLAQQLCATPQACCLPNGRCKDLAAVICELGGGKPQGAETVCDRTRCPQPGDCNSDGHVDLRDFARFQNCFAGGGPVRSGCECADLNGDGDVDVIDLHIFDLNMDGP